MRFKLYSRKSFGYLLAIFIASQIIFPLSTNIYISNIINIVLLGYFLSYILIKKDISFQSISIINIYGIFVFTSFLSLFWSIDFDGTLNLSMSLLIILIDLLLIYNLIQKFKISDYLLYGLILGNIPNFLIAFGVFEYDTSYEYSAFRFVGTSANPNLTAIFLIFSIFSSFILLKKTQKNITQVLLYLNIVISTYVVVLTASRKGILLVSLMLSVFLFKSFLNKKQFFTLALVGTLIWGLLSVVDIGKITASADKLEKVTQKFMELNSALKGTSQNGSAGDRLRFINIGLDLFGNNPLLGTGTATFYKAANVQHYSHNNYIELLVGLGMIGFFIFYSIYIKLLYRIKTYKGDNKYIIFIFLIGLLMMDMALVSYYFKLYIFVLLYLYVYLELKNSHSKVKYANKN